MADFSKVIPGQRFAVQADTWNSVLDAAKAYASGAAAPAAGGNGGGRENFVRFKNTTAARILKGQFVGLGDPVVTYNVTNDNAKEFFKNLRMFQGEALSVADHADSGRFGIALDNVEPDASSYCAIAGIFPCKLNINAEADEYANIVDAQPEALDTQSGASSVRIWWKETGTGTDKWGLVELGRASGSGAALQFVQAVADGSAGSVSVKQIQLKADITASPNFEQSGDAFTVNYFKV
jgi:hypothetical protein